MVRVLYYAGVREKAGAFETRVGGFSGTLAELVKRLEERHGISLTDVSHSQPEENDPFSALIVMVNGRHIAHVGGLETSVSDGDVVSIFPLIGGG